MKLFAANFSLKSDIARYFISTTIPRGEKNNKNHFLQSKEFINQSLDITQNTAANNQPIPTSSHSVRLEVPKYSPTQQY